MLLFPLDFFSFIVYASLFLTSVGSLTLIVLLIVDFYKKKVW
jgi:hypothetical protein